MYPVAYQLIMADLDITHQAQTRTPWKIWILCHMSAYQNNFIIFWILEIMCIRHNSFFVTQSICWKPMATCLWELHFRMFQLCVNLQHNRFSDKKHFARELWHNLKTLEFPENETSASKDLQMLIELFTMEWDVFLLRQRMDPSLYDFNMRICCTNSILSMRS